MDEHVDDIMQEMTAEEMDIIAGGIAPPNGDPDTKDAPIRFLPEGMTFETVNAMMKLNSKLYREGYNGPSRGQQLYRYAREHGADMDERSAYAFAMLRGLPGKNSR